jgi:hypothetical protein
MSDRVNLNARITFRMDDEVTARELLSRYALKPSRGTFIHLVQLPLDDERTEALISELSSKGISYSIKKELVFSETDLENAEFLEMAPKAQAGYPQPEEGYEDETYDSERACNICGRGAEQIRPFKLKRRPGFGRNDIVAMFWTYEFMITENVKDLIEDAGLTGAEFWPILSSGRSGTQSPIDDLHQLRFTNEMPPMSSSTGIETVKLPRMSTPCICGKLGRNLPLSSQIVYRRCNLDDACDFNRTSEWLGGGFDTSQFKIVSNRVYELFSIHGIRGVDFRPVRVEE